LICSIGDSEHHALQAYCRQPFDVLCNGCQRWTRVLAQRVVIVPDQLRFQRHFSFSDRIRYYWPHPEAQSAVEKLFARLGDAPIPEPLISQYLGGLYPEVVDGSLPPRPNALVVGAIRQVLMRYENACSRI
jgi:tagatose-1,6-bisphosphate aldolase non-catalytic subunit AgaZ/GatZ